MKFLKIISFITVILAVPFILAGNDFKIKVIKHKDALPENFCGIWEEGDTLISDSKYFILLGGEARTSNTILNVPRKNTKGSIISFVPIGENCTSSLNIGSPVLSVKEDHKYLNYSSTKFMENNSENRFLEYKAFTEYRIEEGKRIEIETSYFFIPEKGKIKIHSSMTNAGEKIIENIKFYLYFDACHQYSFSPFHSKEHKDLKYRVFQKKGNYLGWINLNQENHEEKNQKEEFLPGETSQVHYVLLVNTNYNPLLEQIYNILNIKTEEATINLENFNSDLMELIIRDAFSHSVFFRSFFKKDCELKIVLPKGIYKARANFFPAISEKLFIIEENQENLCELENPPLGIVEVKIKNSKGESIPGKVSFIGLYPTQTPYFTPENPVNSGKRWESFKNSCFPGKERLELSIPAGTYLAYASRGPEFSVDKKVIEVFKDTPHKLTFNIEKIIKTLEFVSIDPHMHTIKSDGTVTIEERIKSVVAEGVEIAISTDHNYIIDYSTVLHKLGLENYLTVIPGNEVTTSGLIHFNTFPLKVINGEENNGAINPLAEKAGILFKTNRKKNPEAIIQVNHPRSGSIGYFNNINLDKDTAAFADKDFDTSFDVLEILNGPYLYHTNFESINDWLNLLNRGYYFPLMGSSDTHSIDREEPGYSRTYVFYREEKWKHLDWEKISESIKQGKSFATNGPIINLKINDRFSYGNLVPSKTGEIKMDIEVKSAPWVAVNKVRLIINGERDIIFPVNTAKSKIHKFKKSLSIHLEKDSYIVVEAVGNESLFPVLQRTSGSGEIKESIIPYALTNPVFIDINGNGIFDPPISEKIEL